MGVLRNPKHELIAQMVAQGLRTADISEKTQTTVQQIYNLKFKMDVKLRVQELQQEMGLQVVQETVNAVSKWKERFNEGVEAAVECLEDVRDGSFEDAKVASVRMKGALAWLDRAPDAPKPVLKEEKEVVQRFVFDVPVMEGLMRIAAEIGEDVVDGEFEEVVAIEAKGCDNRGKILSVDELSAKYR